MTSEVPQLSGVPGDDFLLDLLADRDTRCSSPDPALQLLADLATALDQFPDPAPRPPVPAGRQAEHSRRSRLITLPVAAAVLLGTVGAAAALGAEPGSPLHPIHTLLYGSDQPTPAGKARAQLKQARHDLDIAAKSVSPGNDSHLAAAVTALATAASLLTKISDPKDALALRADLGALQARADLLRRQTPDQPSQSGNSGPNQTGGAHNGGSGSNQPNSPFQTDGATGGSGSQNPPSTPNQTRGVSGGSGTQGTSAASNGGGLSPVGGEKS